ncbi:hypothetical protein FB45DRAFT_161751 [Roridomyces roridus]|uniref:F-box domain-containing protein n=1 Tax=Roridomyces roridus TaxID=1738132 RepID=A0AAD7FES7_9AGAR|nr:hypothetical protein FB45DRAFT_161751 [Roridomyces roridus]
MPELPPELVLELFPHFTLKALIAAEGVCRQWKEFVVTTDVYPPRRSLLNLYQKIICDPLFRDVHTRPWLWENLRPFDRQAYLDHIYAQHNYIPEEFRLWILEWPNKAVIGCAWPGLPAAYCAEEADDIERFVGYNHLGCLTPKLHKIVVDLKCISPPDASSDGDGMLDQLEEDVEDEHSEDGENESGSDEEYPEDYYRNRRTPFSYVRPSGPEPAEFDFPALLIWEKSGWGQVFLALTPPSESPFAVYDMSRDNGVYYSGQNRQYVTWIDWLEAQLRRMHRAADWEAPLHNRIHPEHSTEHMDPWFRTLARAPPLWTEEDEERYRLARLGDL